MDFIFELVKYFGKFHPLVPAFANRLFAYDIFIGTFFKGFKKENLIRPFV